MNEDAKKIQVVLCFITGIGLFLPLLKISAYEESVSFSFMQAFDSSEIVNTGFISAKIVIAVLVVALITLLIRFKNNNFILKILSLLFIIASGVLYYIDVDKISAAKLFFSSMMKYGYGYYLTLGGYIISIILGVIDIISNGSSSRNGYPADYDMVINAHYNNNNSMNPNQTTSTTMNTTNSNPVNNNANQVVTNQPSFESQNNQPNNQVKLSDLVNQNHDNQ